MRTIFLCEYFSKNLQNNICFWWRTNLEFDGGMFQINSMHTFSSTPSPFSQMHTYIGIKMFLCPHTQDVFDNEWG